MTSGFIEVGLSPEYESGKKEVIRDFANNVQFVSNDFDILLGMTVKLKLCAVNPVVLEMLTGAVLPSDAAVVLNDTKRFACQEPIMLEVWSKNAGYVCPPGGPVASDGGLFIHWVLPLTSQWTISSDLTFNSGALDVEVSGYATSNEGWFPSFPDPEMDWPSYVPAESLSGWPTGAPPVVLPMGAPVDSWTMVEAAAVRDGGPLAWRCVNELPSPLSDCAYFTPSGVPPCENPAPIVYDLHGNGPVPNPPWLPVQIPITTTQPDPPPVPPYFTLPALVETVQGVVPTVGPSGENSPQGGYLDDPLCLCNEPPETPWVEAVMRGPVQVNTENDSQQWVSQILALPWARYDGLNVDYISGLISVEAGWDNINGVGIVLRGEQGYFNLPTGITPFAQNIVPLVDGPTGLMPSAQNYELRVVYDSGNTNPAPWPLTMIELRFDSTLVAQWAIGNVAGWGKGMGEYWSQVSPPCYATTASATPINTATQLFITVTDNGNGTYTIYSDDPNQSGILSDPGGAANNFEGAGPNAVNAPCNPYGPTNGVVQRTFLTSVGDSVAHELVADYRWVTAATGGFSGSGVFTQVTLDVSDARLSEIGAWASAVAGTQARATLDAWVVAYGSGVAVPVVATSTNAVDLIAYNIPTTSGQMGNIRPQGYGIITGNNDPAFPLFYRSPVTEFTVGCNAAAPNFTGLPVHYPSWTIPST